MANTFFDPLRSDPFSTPIATNLNQNQTNQIVPYGEQQQQQQQSTPSSKEHHQESVDDVLLQFGNSSPSQASTQQSPPPTVDVRNSRKQRILHNSPRSIVSPSSLSSRYSNQIAPPPDLLPMGGSKDYSSSLFHMTSEPDPATQPKYELITHSGSCMARISSRTKLLKLWKNVFWITYDDRELLVFKNKNLFEEWLMNPYLTKSERYALVKLRIDFMVEPSTYGYQISRVKPKYYRKSGMVHQFKLDKWDMSHGPSILAAFGSCDSQDAAELNIVLKELLKKSPIYIDNMGYHHNFYDATSSHSGGSVSGGESVYSAPTFARLQGGHTSSTRSV